jgi:hypothetical protein
MPLSIQAAVIDTVSAYHSKRIRELTDKRRDIISDFLGLKREKSPSSSTMSYSQ